MSRREGVRAAGLAFAFSALCSLGLAAIYLAGGQPQLEGVLLAGSLGGLGAGLVAWALGFSDDTQKIEPRTPPSRQGEPGFEALSRQFDKGASVIGRRKALGRMFAAAAGALGIAALFPLASLGPDPGRTLFHTSWRRGSRVVTGQGRALRAEDLAEGGVLTVFPEGHTEAADSAALLIRMQSGAELQISGLVCYSKICTHAGCPVGLYQSETQELICPCHQSVFNAAEDARPISGPAVRPLPSLELEVDSEGFLVAAGDFDEPVGPSFWNINDR